MNFEWRGMRDRQLWRRGRREIMERSSEMKQKIADERENKIKIAIKENKGKKNYNCYMPRKGEYRLQQVSNLLGLIIVVGP